MGRLAERVVGTMASVAMVGGLGGSAQARSSVDAGKTLPPGVYLNCSDPSKGKLEFTLQFSPDFVSRIGDRDIHFDTVGGNLSEIPQPGVVPTSEISTGETEGVQTVTITETAKPGKPTYRVTMNPNGEWEVTPRCGEQK